MQMHDTNQDGKIQLSEFENMLLGCNVKEQQFATSQVLEK
jgi:hypothetical protein